MSAVGENLLHALRDSLADFRVQVEGEPGRKVRALGPQSGTIHDLSLTVLSTVADALAWLGNALGDALRLLQSVDALQALLEVARDLLGSLSQGLSFGGLPEAYGLDPRPFQAVGEAVGTGRDALALGARVVGLVPAPEDVAAIRKELVLLLGRRVDPSAPNEGSLGALLMALKPGAAPSPSHAG